MSNMVWNMGLNSSVKAVKSSMLFIFSRYLRRGLKYLTVSFASKHAMLTSFNSLQHVPVNHEHAEGCTACLRCTFSIRPPLLCDCNIINIISSSQNIKN